MIKKSGGRDDAELGSPGYGGDWRDDMDLENRIVETGYTPEDSEVENPLRPRTFSEYIGQDKVKENLKIFIEAAKSRKEPLDHVLLYGPPGLGKTTLAGIVANEMGVNLRITSGPAIEKPGDLAALLTNLSPGDVLFIDEVHRLPRTVEEILYPAMEDYALDTEIEADGALEIASRSRGTPRIANRLLKRVRDFAQVMSEGVVTYHTAQIALDRLEVDELGLDSSDRRMLAAIIQNYAGGPVGLDTLAAAIGEEAITIEDVNEPYLMQIGFLTRTPRGRCATAAAYLHLGLPVPPALRGGDQGQLTLEN